MTDITKYKSVAIKIDSYNSAKRMADEKYMSMGSYIKYLIDEEFNRRIDDIGKMIKYFGVKKKLSKITMGEMHDFEKSLKHCFDKDVR